MAREAGFVALDRGQGRRTFGEAAEGERGSRGLIDGGVGFGEFGGHVVHLIVEEGGLHDPGALESPAGGGHFLDEKVLGGGAGGELGDEGFVEEEESECVFVVDADGVGGLVAGGRAGGPIGGRESVAGGGGVGGGAGFAFGCDGPARFLPVGAGGGGCGG